MSRLKRKFRSRDQVPNADLGATDISNTKLRQCPALVLQSTVREPEAVSVVYRCAQDYSAAALHDRRPLVQEQHFLLPFRRELYGCERGRDRGLQGATAAA